MNEVVEEGGVGQRVSECMGRLAVHWARVWGVVGMRRGGCLVGWVDGETGLTVRCVEVFVGG